MTFPRAAAAGLAAALALMSGCRPAAVEPPILTPEERAWLRAHQPLRFAPDPAFPPIEWIDETGRYRGLVADTFEIIGQRLGARIEIVRCATWNEVLQKAQDREVDGITAAQPTPERSAFLGWTPPILDIPNVIVARTSPGGELTLQRLAGRKVAVTAGNALHEYLRSSYPGIQVVPVADDMAALTAVSFGAADAAVVNLAVASYLIELHGIANLRVAGDSGRSNPLAIAVRSDRPILRSIMTKGLAAVTASEREAIRSRWIHFQGGTGPSLRALLVIAAAIAILAGLSLAWNASLRRQVAKATAGLEAELGERRRAEEALRQSERKLALHLEQTLFGVIEFDREFRVVYWNPASERIFGWSGQEVLGKLALELLVPASTGAKVDEAWRSLRANSGGRHIVNQNLTRGGRVITCEWFNTPLFDRDGAFTGVMSLASDVSERERREEIQARAQRLESLAVLAGGIAHDFNNLLTGILANVSLAQTDHPQAPIMLEILGETEAAARRAQTLTRQLLTFSRGGAPMKSLLDLAGVVGEAATFVARGATAVVRVEAAEGLWPVEADAGQIGQVVQNLVLNALEAMPAGGAVEVDLANVEPGPAGTPPAASVRLRVADRGPGIPADQLPHIFDPFVSTKARGSGLGLAVVHSIVARHGGHVEVRSTVGEGTTFDVFLPARPGVSARPVMGPLEPARARGRILVMDDEEVVRRAAERVLTGMGCEVALAADGAEALETWTAWRERGSPFDVVVVDLTVPGALGGVETLERLRSLDPAVKVVVSSGYSTSPVMADFRERGFAAAIPKPWDADEVRRVVAELIGPLPGVPPGTPAAGLRRA